MVFTCFVCKHRSDQTPGRTFHRFPTEVGKRREQWLDIFQNAGYTKVGSILCSNHFEPGSFKPGTSQLKDGVIPTLNLINNQGQKRIASETIDSLMNNVQSQNRPPNRNQISRISTPKSIGTVLSMNKNANSTGTIVTMKNGVPTITVAKRIVSSPVVSKIDLTAESTTTINNNTHNNASPIIKVKTLPVATTCTDSKPVIVPSEVSSLVATRSSSVTKILTVTKTEIDGEETKSNHCGKTGFTIENFKDDDRKFFHFTGLKDYNQFQYVLENLDAKTFFPIADKINNVNLEIQFFIVLWKLNRNTPTDDLSVLFDIDEVIIIKIIKSWIAFMSQQWPRTDLWLPRTFVHSSMPRSFTKNFPRTRIILDELLIELDLGEMDCDKKLLKVIIGTTPSENICYCSRAYAASCSNRTVIEESNLMDKCDPHDTIMADDSFDIQDLFSATNIVINKPNLFEEHPNLTGISLYLDNHGRSRICINKVRELKKSFKILSALPLTLEALASDIINVCIMLHKYRETSMHG